MKYAKTTEFAERMFEIPVARCSDQSLYICGPLDGEKLSRGQNIMQFRVPIPAGTSTELLYSAYQGMLKHLCGCVGLDPEDYSSHSLRRNGFPFLSLSGTTLEKFRVPGDWVGDTIFAYLRTPLSVSIMNNSWVSTMLLVTPVLRLSG